MMSLSALERASWIGLGSGLFAAASSQVPAPPVPSPIVATLTLADCKAIAELIAATISVVMAGLNGLAIAVHQYEKRKAANRAAASPPPAKEGRDG